MPIINSGFRPAWWARNPHLQTLWPKFARRHPLVQVETERVELADGDFIDLAWSRPAHLANAPIVLLLHGLEGSIRSHYATGLMRALNRVGLRACLMHFRGCSGEPNRLPIAYHSGKTDDPALIREHLQQQHGEVYGAVGVSLGGNVLLKWLGEQGEQGLFQRAAVISVPYVLDDCARRLRKGLSRIYEKHLVGSLQQGFREKYSRIPCPLDVDVGRLDTFHRFDDQVTAPLHGFSGVDDYYARCSSRQYIPRICVPTLILHAADDPFMYPGTVPTQDELPDSVSLELTSHGGHVGFVSGPWPWKADYWAERRISEWMAAEQLGTK